MSASESRSGVVLELAEEFLERYRQGQRPSLKEYIDRHPELAAEIKDVFPAMAMMENIALADESLAGDGEASREHQPPESLQQLGDYRILREVGRGGMGIVYEAEQVSLGRHVALKVLPRKVLLDATQKRRFERESKAAAKLHHSNIVPVFGVGEHDGLPYYVMQFIKGLGLDEVLNELKRMQSGGTSAATDGEVRVSRKDVSAVEVARSLLTGAFPGTMDLVNSPAPAADAPGAADSATAKLSDSFTLSSSSVVLPASRVKGKKATYWQSVAQIGAQVADALEYAHKQGILHRDIKPSNLLLDTRGTVWVADFGLARAETEDHLTHTGDIVGTLRYMPPEAFEGRTDKRGDLYSLGLTLYELLALKPAFEDKDRRQLIKRVTTEEPPRLDRLNRAIPRDLVTIVHKAIDREPSRRYQVAGELAADLQRFLDDEPIQARRVSAVERAGRWCRHHPGVAGLTAALLLLLVGITVASLLAAAHFDQLARHEVQARREAVEAQEHETALRKQAEEAKQQAEGAKRQAEANFTKARQAVDDSFTKVSESQLLHVPGMQPLRRDLLQSALAFHQDFLKERSDDPALRGELAAAYLRAGKIHAELDEEAKAAEAYEQARELYEVLTDAAPESVEWRHGLARCYFWLGRFDEAIELWEKLVQPGQPRYQKALADAYDMRASDRKASNRPAEALQAYQQSLTIREMLVRLNPDDPDAQCDLSASLNNIGALLMRTNRHAEALAIYRRAAEYAEAAFAQAPHVLLNGRFLTIQRRNIAGIERRLGHVNEALSAYRRVVEVWRKLARDNPAVPKLHSGLFGAYRDLALYQRSQKQTKEAERTMRLALEAIDRLSNDGPEALFVLACVRAACSAVLSQEGGQLTDEERAEPKRQADLAMEALQKAVAAGFRSEVRLHMEQSLDLLRGRGDFKRLEADLAARVAAASPDKPQAGQRIGADPQDKQLHADRAASQHAIALILLDLGKIDEAQSRLEQAVALRETLVKDDPKQAQLQADLTASRLALELVLCLVRARQALELKHNPEAETALAKIAVLKSDDPGVWKERGRCYFALGQTKQAAADFRRAVDLLGEEAEPNEPAVTAADKLFAEIAAEAHLKSLTAAIERKPEDMARRKRRGEWYARHMRWEPAAADLKMMLQRQPPAEALGWMRVAPVLAAGDRDGYHWLCREMVNRFGDTNDPARAERVAKACLLLPDTTKETEVGFRLADRAVELGRNQKWQTYYIFCKGLADYRGGNFRAAAERLEPHVARLGDLPDVRTCCHLVLAMALHRQRQAKAARDHLARAAKLLEQYAGEPGRVPVYGREFYSHDWVIAWLLHREAQTLMEEKKSEAKK